MNSTYFLYFTVIIIVINGDKLRVGHLVSFGEEEREILKKCVDTSSIELISLEACDHFNGLESAAQLHYNLGADIFTGAFCDEESGTISQLAFRWNKIYISTSSRIVGSREQTTISLQPDTIPGFAKALIALCRELSWNRVSILYDKPNTINAMEIKSVFTTKDDSINVTITIEIGEYHWFERISEKSRVLIAVCSLDELTEVIIPNILEYNRPNEFIILHIDLNKMTPEDFEKVRSHTSDIARSKKRNILYPYIFFIRSNHHNAGHISKWAAKNNLSSKAHDRLKANLLNCDALSIASHVNGTDKSLESIWKQIVQHTDHGFSGPIFISPQGGRQPFLTIYGYLNNTVVPAALLKPVPNNCSEDFCTWHKLFDTEYSMDTIYQAPPAIPVCDFDGSLCSEPKIFLIFLFISIILTVPLAIIFHFHKKDKEMMRMPWRIDHDQLTFQQNESDHPGFRRISTASSQKISTTSEPDFNNRKFAYLEGSKMYTHAYIQKRSLTFSREEMEKLNQLKYIHHANVNSFAGLAFNQQSELIALWSYCVRGSLDDILFGSERRLGRNFQSTFVKHILNGVQYIHQSSIKVHGALFLTNCVVDSYWVVKLTDFGMTQILRTKMEHKEIISKGFKDLESMPRNFLQYPPEYLELLKDTKDQFALEPTVTGDIYQIGMLIYQILFYQRPFQERFLCNEEIINQICSSNPIYPALPDKTNDFTLRVISIMQQCWLQRTSARPALFKIIDAVAREFGKHGGTLIDQLIKMVDEYSDNLEQIVAERTSKIEEEQLRTQQILHQIMPREIAEVLRDGKQPRPKLHPSVSILMIDVCQFTELCESCIPVHVLEILQQLYSSFDQIITKFRAFKVENVGDAYLLVSGIPEIAENKHLAEVCRIALKLKEFMKTLVVVHRPDHKLRIKIGISCGAVAAGILGITAPRFCVFGESVNMACRMAGSGLPEKIQVSEMASETIRNDFPEFRIEERGTVILKGKGPVTTYWLLDDSEDLTPKDPHCVI